MNETGQIRVEAEGATAVVTIDNPAKRNALSDQVLDSLVISLIRLDSDPAIRAIVLAGQPKVFASGADVAALLERETLEAFDGHRSRNWQALREFRTPVIAAVSGYCLGGGLELAMMADVIIASDTAKFGLPETQLGLIPGAGGTQLLPRLIGKALAMDLILTGRLLDSAEALGAGLISRVVPVDEVLSVAKSAAEKVAGRPAVAQRMAKQLVSESFETGLSAGITNERKAFGMVFGSTDAREGMKAFVEGRDPRWKHG